MTSMKMVKHYAIFIYSLGIRQFCGGETTMANLKSAIKRVRTNETKRERNRAVKTNMRTHIKRVEHFIETNDVDNAKLAFNQTAQVIDKAIQKGVIHRNNGNRQKSRLAKKLQDITA